MPDCPHCGRHLNRRHRTLLEKLVFADVLVCQKCQRPYRLGYLSTQTLRDFVFSRQTHCVKCGSDGVRRLVRRDPIDSVSKHPLSLLFRLTGAPRNKCDACRLQDFDWRPVR